MGGASEDADTWADNNGNNSFVDKISWSKIISINYIFCEWKPKVEKLRGRAKKLAEMLEVVRSQVFS